MLIHFFSLQTHFPIFFSSSTNSNRIRLSTNDLESSLNSDSSSDNESDTDPPSLSTRFKPRRIPSSSRRSRNNYIDQDTSDELPRESQITKIDYFKLKLNQLGTAILAGGGGGGGDNSNRTGLGRRDKDAGIASAFWGSRTGGIKLNDNTSSLPSTSSSSRLKPKSKLKVTLLERVPSSPSSFLSSPNSLNYLNSNSPKASSTPTLFDLGEEEEGEELGDAVELPREVRLIDENSRGFPSKGLR